MNGSDPSRILLIDSHTERATQLHRRLLEQGYLHCQVISYKQLQRFSDAALDPELILLVQQQVDNAVLSLLLSLAKISQSPIILFSLEPIDVCRGQQLADAGICCYHSIDPRNVPLKPLIDNGRLQFKRVHQIEAQLTAVRTQLAERKLIERAKGLLMKRHQCDEQQAYVAMRTLAMNRAQPLAEVARSVLDSLDH